MGRQVPPLFKTAEVHTMQKEAPRRGLRRIVTVMLFVFAAVGIVCGFAMKRRYQQQQAAEALRALGGEVAATPSSLLDALEVAHFVSMPGLKLGDEDLRPLAQLPDLTMVSLAHNQITDAGLVHVGGLSELQTLDLKHNPGITDAGLEHLEGLTQLKVLVLYGTKVTAAGVEELRKALPNTKVGFQAAEGAPKSR